MFLCDTCRNIKPLLVEYVPGKRQNIDSYTIHHENAIKLKEAADSDCMVCSPLWSQLFKDVEFRNLLGLKPATFCLGQTAARKPEHTITLAWLTFYRNVQSDKENGPVPLEVFGCFPYPADMAPRLSRSISFDTSAQSTMNTAKEWFQNCLSSHDRCNHDQHAKWYPTRILYLGETDAELKLIVTKNQDITGRYASLSHCWGKIPILKLLVENTEEFQTGIDISKLPKSFCHAIAIARDFGIRLLWIDSLCIIQDSPEDWRHEAALMGRVYKYSSLNLSASGAWNGSEGCFFKRKPSIVGPPPECPEFRNFDWRKHHGPGERCYFVDAEFWQHMCLRSPLFRRAWIYQERLLARRVLHFGEEQLFWECRTDNYCETFPDGLPSTLRDSTHFLSKFMYDQFQGGDFSQSVKSGRFLNMRDRSREEKVEVFWESLVTDYTRCSLTMSGDKLIALSGMAEDVHNVLSAFHVDTEYLAGIWKVYLPHSLLWKIMGKGARPEKYRAPTWSWASVDGIIRWDDCRWKNAFRYVCQVESADTSIVQSKYGEVQGGTLTITGPMWKFNAFKDAENQVWISPCLEGTMTPEVVSIKENSLKVSPDQDVEVWEGQDVFGMLLVLFEDVSVEAVCMIVMKPVANIDGTFQRVGVAFSGRGFAMGGWAVNEAVRRTVVLI